MKKARFILPMLTALLMGFGMTSCENEYFGDSNTRVMEATVCWNHWRTYVDNVENKRYMYVTYEWNALTVDVLNYGSVTAYVYDGDSQCPLPHVVPITYTYNDGSVVVVPESFRYELTPGKITIIMQDLDGELPEGIDYNFPDVSFRVVAMMPVR